MDLEGSVGAAAGTDRTHTGLRRGSSVLCVVINTPNTIGPSGTGHSSQRLTSSPSVFPRPCLSPASPPASGELSLCVLRLLHTCGHSAHLHASQHDRTLSDLPEGT